MVLRRMKSEILNVGCAHICAWATFDPSTLITFSGGLLAFVVCDPWILWMFINANNTEEFNGNRFNNFDLDSFSSVYRKLKGWLRE